MANIEYAIFRTKFVRPSQPSLFEVTATPSEVFEKCIQDRPSSLYRNVEWHIGNVTEFGDGLGYFRVGKRKADTVSEFDDESGDFFDKEADTTEYAHCIYDLKIGAMGIAKNWRLTYSVQSVANIVSRLFESVELVEQNRITVEIDPIPSPDEFLDQIISAYRVQKFTATFKGPNPFDADEFFQKPLARLCNDSGAKSGKAELNGSDLDREVLAEISRSTAATGNTASARIRTEVDAPVVTVRLDGMPMTLVFTESEHDPEVAAKELRSEYRKLRFTEEARNVDKENR